jgi:Fe-S-cluster containining protein
MIELPISNPCHDCHGSCCRQVVMPPFIPLRSNHEWNRLARERPELRAELEVEYARREHENDWPDEAPCFWLDVDTGLCKHHDDRPQICRDYEVGGSGCTRTRAMFGLPPCS